MASRIDIHNRSVATRTKRIRQWGIPLAEKKALLRFIDELALGKVNRGRRISESRQCKYLDVLRLPLEFFRKSMDRLRTKDIEAFEKAIGSGQLKSNRKAAYSHATRVDMRRALKVYLRWRLGPRKAAGLTDWLDTRTVNKTPDFLKETDIESLFKACKSAEERFLIAVLFDTGARATEFHNIRYEDMEELDKKFTGTEVETLKTSFTRLQQEATMKDERIHDLEKAIEVLQHNWTSVSHILALKPSVRDLQSALARKSKSVGQ
ncbi:MAG: hypothetical protein NTY01_14010 [Verrucomicrobia bacterium]|nr:hypothetical protein [Verrucomicrobiota bacterium]